MRPLWLACPLESDGPTPPAAPRNRRHALPAKGPWRAWQTQAYFPDCIAWAKGPEKPNIALLLGCGTHQAGMETGRPRLAASSVVHVALKPKRKVILKDPLTGLLSGGPEAKCAALRPQSSQEANFPKHDSWSDGPALLFSSMTLKKKKTNNF